MRYLIERLQEPSTWASIATLLVGLHVSIDPGLWQHLADAGVALSGVAAMLLKESPHA